MDGWGGGGHGGKELTVTGLVSWRRGWRRCWNLYALFWIGVVETVGEEYVWSILAVSDDDEGKIHSLGFWSVGCCA